MKKRVYLDYAAATQIDPKVKTALDNSEAYFANPSAQYASAREAKKLLEQARKEAAMTLGANSDEIVFTSGATESNNIAILGSARAQKKGRIISIGSEHASVRESINQLEKEGFEVVWCKLGAEGMVSKKAFEMSLSKDTILVSIAYANGEIGTIQPIIKISKLIREFESKHKIKILFHTDASAAACFLNCEVARLGVDMMTLSGNKLYGPAGIGGLYVRRGTKINSITFGGSQESRLRAGTQPVCLAVGFAKALQMAQKQITLDFEKTGELMAVFDKILSEEGALHMLGPMRHRERLPNMRSISFDGINGEDIVAYMDAAGFEIATGAACEAANEAPSQALLVIGLSTSEAQGTVRISIGRQTTRSDVEAAANTLVKTLETLGYKWDNKD